MMPLRRRPALWALAAVGTVVALAGVIVVVARARPVYRTTFLVDASVTGHADFQAVRSSVAAAARNAGDRDALALRRFGGECGDRGNTRSLAKSKRGNRERIGAEVQALTPRGRPTLRSGVLAAIDDFSGRYPFRGRKGNRIIVVTGHGTDACTGDQAALGREIKSRAEAAGIRLDLRFVGYKTPPAGQEALGRIASASGYRAPVFTRNGAELAATLKKYTVPTSGDPRKITLPERFTTTRPCTLRHERRGWDRTSRPSRFRLPDQVTLPPGTAVYEVPHHPSGTGASRFIGEAGKASCSGGPPAEASEGHHISATVRKTFPEGPDSSDPVQMSMIDLIVEDPYATCYLFPDKDREAGAAPRCGTVAAAIGLLDRKNIATGDERYQAALSSRLAIGNWQHVPGTIEVALAVRRPGAYNPAIVCTQPKDRSDICAAALAFHFVEAMKDLLPKSALDRGTQQIRQYVSAV